MMPPWRPGWRVSRSQRRALCQSFGAALRDIAANRTGPASLPRQTGQGAWGCGMGKPGRAAEIENKACLQAAAQPAPEGSRQGTESLWQAKGLAKIGEVGEALDRQIMSFPVRRI